MQCNYIAIDGQNKRFDLDKVIDLVGGSSKKRDWWPGFITFTPNKKIFVEHRDSPQDARGISHSEVEEVTAQYIEAAYKLRSTQITRLLDKRGFG